MFSLFLWNDEGRRETLLLDSVFLVDKRLRVATTKNEDASLQATWLLVERAFVLWKEAIGTFSRVINRAEIEITVTITYHAEDNLRISTMAVVPNRLLPTYAYYVRV